MGQNLAEKSTSFFPIFLGLFQAVPRVDCVTAAHNGTSTPVSVIIDEL